jgi:hydroxymethylbilane synthase
MQIKDDGAARPAARPVIKRVTETRDFERHRVGRARSLTRLDAPGGEPGDEGRQKRDPAMKIAEVHANDLAYCISALRASGSRGRAGGRLLFASDMPPASPSSPAPRSRSRTTLTYATRRSPLALAQCRAFVASLRATDETLDLQELQVVTSGDRIQDRPLYEVGGKGLFVKEIEEAILEGRAQFAVHSIKDVPAALPSGLVIACVPPRADPRDVLVAPRSETLARLPPGARVGTSSLRRAITLKVRRPDLDIVPLRGNVDTRLRKVDAGECDAVILAYSGLLRLGLEARITEVLETDVSLPAPGQGALGIECLETDGATRALLSRLHHADSAGCVAAERGVLIALGGDCKTPLGAHAERVPAGLRIRAFIANPDGTNVRHADTTLPWPGDERGAHDAGLTVGRALGA